MDGTAHGTRRCDRPPHPATGPRKPALPQRLRRGSPDHQSREGDPSRVHVGCGSGEVPLLRQPSSDQDLAPLAAARHTLRSTGRCDFRRRPPSSAGASTRSPGTPTGASLAALGGRPPPARLALRADDGRRSREPAPSGGASPAPRTPRTPGPHPRPDHPHPRTPTRTPTRTPGHPTQNHHHDPIEHQDHDQHASAFPNDRGHRGATHLGTNSDPGPSVTRPLDP